MGGLERLKDLPLALRSLDRSVSGFLEQMRPARQHSTSDLQNFGNSSDLYTVEPKLLLESLKPKQSQPFNQDTEEKMQHMQTFMRSISPNTR